MARVLVVDDEDRIRRVLNLLLTDAGYDVTAANSGETAIREVEGAAFDVMLLDMTLPGLSGLDVMRALQDRGRMPVCIVVTAFGSIRSAVDAVKAGAFDYLTKPFDNEQLLLSVARGVEHRRLHAEVDALRTEIESRYGFGEIVGSSQAMRDLLRVMAKVSASDATVLILGESGTGKELVAHAIHRRSRRAAGPFVAVNCSAIPSTLVEAEFFGHERGAFTDAKEARPGKFEQAHSGTLFLDEIGDLPLDSQAKLLRALEEREVTRLGAIKPIATDVRVLAATNKPLESVVARGGFREDLFWRLNVLSLRLPPIRERAEDLNDLIDHLLARSSRDLGTSASSLAPDARRLLLAHDWPGNVRELENVLRGSLILAEDDVIRVSDLPARLRGGNLSDLSGANGATPTLTEAVNRATERLERSMIRAALDNASGSRSQAAEALGINRKTLFNKMRSYGLVADTDEDQ